MKEESKVILTIMIIICFIISALTIVWFSHVINRLQVLEAERQEQIDQREYEDLIEIIIQELEARQ